MLLIETKIQKQQARLEEQFCRQGNFFAVPFKKILPLTQIIDTIMFQIFDNSSQQEDQKYKNSSVLIEKIRKLIDDILKMSISLTAVRDVFSVVRDQERKIRLYEEHILNLNRIIMDEFDPKYGKPDPYQLEFQGLFNENLISRSHVTNLESDMNGEDFEETIYKKLLQKQKKQSQCSIQLSPQKVYTNAQEQAHAKEKARASEELPTRESIRKYEQQIEEDSLEQTGLNVSSTLNLQIQSSMQFRQSLEQELLELKYFGREELVISEEESSSHNCSFITVEETKNEKKQFVFDRETNCTFYRPQWKKVEIQQKKAVQNLLPVATAQSKKNIDSSDYLQNLSSRFNPNPSILNDVSISAVVFQQKKQDIRRSNILKQSIKDSSQAPFSASQRLYAENIKMVKLQHKFRSIKRVEGEGAKKGKNGFKKGVNSKTDHKEELIPTSKTVGPAFQGNDEHPEPTKKNFFKKAFTFFESNPRT